MRCIYCDSLIDKYNLKSVIYKQDLLCVNCRDRLRVNKKIINIDGVSVTSFYEYDSFFKDLLIQYKECYDEALSEVFLYDLNEYIKFKYFNYKLLLMPSSKAKLDKRGFNHLELMFKDVGLDIVKGLKMIDDNMCQEGKSYQERQAMKNNYYYDGGKLNKVLLVDDVCTSGASLLGAYRALKPHCNRINCLSLAYVGKRFHLK